jgi:quercetin dioxygenase-like cupin family protein
MFVPTNEGTRLRLLGSTATVKATTEDTAGATEWMVIESGRGSDVAPHRHPWGEAYYILAGTLEVQIGARKHVATVGDFLTIPPRAVHGFEVVSDSARFLHVSTGGGAVDAFIDYANVSPEVPDPTDDEAMTALAEVNERHGLVFLTPASV